MSAEVLVDEITQSDSFLDDSSIKPILFEVKGDPIIHLICRRDARRGNCDDKCDICFTRRYDWRDPRALACAMQSDFAVINIKSRLQIFQPGNYIARQVLEICCFKIAL